MVLSEKLFWMDVMRVKGFDTDTDAEQRDMQFTFWLQGNRKTC